MSKNIKSVAFYVTIILVFGSLMYLVAKEGESQQITNAISSSYDSPKNLSEGFVLFRGLLLENIKSSLGILLLQIIAILVTCRIFGWLFKKIGQPTVIGEILAGIVLGPSVLGNISPEASAFLFPIESLGNITILSQFGLILFMFAIGMELNLTEIRQKLNETILISHTSTIVPFFFGMLTAYFVYEKYADKSIPFLSFALFIGIAMSITAFPVLARIIQEKGLTKTHLGVITLASAANGDITAWCLLAVVIAIAQAGTMLSAVYNIGFSILYIVIMFLAIRPFLRMVGQIYHNKEVIDKGIVAFILLLLVISSYFTEILGLHALFFASTGLRTEIGLIDSSEQWILCTIFILVAIVGKFGGAMFSARFVGESWKDSLYIGALMNTRGLMELVVLTIGYEMGILTPSIFVMLVIMTLVTTFMTTPLVSFIKFCYKTHDKIIEQKRKKNEMGLFKVLLSFGRAGNGQIMLDVAYQMFAQGKNKLDLTALHLTVGSDVNPLHTDNFEEVSFGPILYGAKKLGLQIHTRYEISDNAGLDICNIVNNEGFDFLLVGAGISLSNTPDDIAANRYRTSFYNRFLKRFKAPESWFYPGSLLKDKTKLFIEQTQCPVGVFVNRNFVKATNAIIIINSADDLFLIDYAKTLLRTTCGKATLLNLYNGNNEESEQIKTALSEANETTNGLLVSPEKKLTAHLFNDFNFMLISYKSWNTLSEQKVAALQSMPSTLILSNNHRQVKKEATKG